MSGSQLDWQDIYQKDRLLSIASMTPPDWALPNAVQQRGVVAPGTTRDPSGASQIGQVSQGPVDQALMANPDLMGRALHWGIPAQVAASMPMDQLEHLIQSHEQDSRQAEGQASAWSQLAAHVLAVPAMFGTGAVKAVLEAPRNIPVVGEYFRKMESLNGAIAGVAGLEEGVRAATRSDFQWVNSTAEVGGSLASMWYPGAAVWRAAAIAGKAPAIIGITSPIIRMAAQGGAAGWLLEGGGEHSRAGIIGGAVLGAAAHPIEQALITHGPALAAAMDRVSKYFGGSWSRYVKPAAGAEEAMAEALTKASVAQPAVADMAAASNIEQLRAMSIDPAATQETRQQAQEFLNYFGGRKVTLEPGLPSEGQGLPPRVAASLDAALAVPAEPVGMTLPEAQQSAAQMSKAGIIIDSPVLGEAVGQVTPNDGTVAKALGEMNPGGTNIVPAVASPAEFMQQVGMNPTGMPHVRFARRQGGTQLDALLSDEPITDRMISQYEEHGVFEGQSAQTAAGRDVVVQSIDNGLATVAPRYGGAPHYVPVGDLLPSAATSTARPVPGLYEELGAYVQGRVSATADAMGGALDTSMLGRIRNEGLPGYIEDFLDQSGVHEPGQRARVRQYFNERVVEDYSMAVPEEEAFQRGMETHAALAEAASPEPTPLRRLDQMAQTKGFMVVPDGATGGYKLVDMIATPVGTSRPPTTILFNDRAAAEEWIKKVSRSAPDVTPASEVPVEIARSLPTTSHLEPSLDNGRLHNATHESASDIADAVAQMDPQLGDHLHQVIAEAKASGDLGKIHQSWEYSWGHFQPMRARWSTIEQRLGEAGLGDIRPAADWDTQTTNQVHRHNWEHSRLDQWARMTDHFNIEDARSGKAFSIYSIEDDARRLAAAVDAGFNPRQIAALDEIHQFFREQFPETGLDPARELPRYISHVSARQSMGASVGNAFEGYSMNSSIEPFYQMVRSGNMQLREVDIRNIGNVYIRAMGFEKFMRKDWDIATTKWRGIAKIPELKPLADTFMNWANLMKTGYIPGNDQILNSAHSVMQTLMPGFTKAQTAKIFNQGLSLTHLALLGYRPDVLARDSIQILLALPRAGTDLIAVMRDMATGGAEVRQAMFDRGLKAGTVVLGRPRIAGVGLFEPHMVGVMPGTEATGMLPGMAGMQLVAQEGGSGPLFKVLQATTDALHDLIPDSMRHLQGSKLHPLYFYTKQSEQMRMVVGEAGIRRAERAIGEYRTRMEAPLRTGESAAATEKLWGDSMARTFNPPMQQKFKDLIAAGSDEEAANFIARQLTDATMFRYGMVENAEVARTTFGKMGMQMGNFSTQFYQYAKESVRNGNWQDKAKFWAMMGGVTAGLRAAEQTTGWAFSKWQFYNSLTFTGGPWISNMMDAQELASSVSQMGSLQDDQAGGQYQLNSATAAADRLGRGLTQMLNPVAGLQRTVGGVATALDSPDQASALGRLFMTGERGNSKDWQAIELQAFGPAAPQQQPQMAPYQSPVSGARQGVPLPPVSPVVPMVRRMGASPLVGPPPGGFAPPAGGYPLPLPSGHLPPQPGTGAQF